MSCRVCLCTVLICTVQYKLYSTLEYRTGASRKGWGNDGPCSSHGVSRWLLMFLDVFLSFWFVGLLGVCLIV